MARADKGMGGGVAGNLAGPNGHQAPGTPYGEITETDLANEKTGDAGAQGTDPDRLSNTRERAVDTAPGGKPEPDDDVLDSFRKMDKDVRAAEDLGKGNRSGDTPEAEEADSLVDDMADPSTADASLASRNGVG